MNAQDDMRLSWDSWQPRPDALRVTTIDAHAAGEPLRIVTGGLPELPGATILERRRYLQTHLDHMRRALMWEPRGHVNMYGCIVTPPVTGEAQLGVLFMHNEGYSTMCGHGIIALITTLLETGALPATGAQMPVNLDTPAGLVRALARRLQRIAFALTRDGPSREQDSRGVRRFTGATLPVGARPGL